MTVHGHQPTPGCCLLPGSAVFRGSPDHAELRPEVRSAAGRSNNGGNAELRLEVRSAGGRSNNGGNAELRLEVRSAAGRSNRIAVTAPRPYVRAASSQANSTRGTHAIEAARCSSARVLGAPLTDRLASRERTGPGRTAVRA